MDQCGAMNNYPPAATGRYANPTIPPSYYGQGYDFGYEINRQDAEAVDAAYNQQNNILKLRNRYNHGVAPFAVGQGYRRRRSHSDAQSTVGSRGDVIGARLAENYSINSYPFCKGCPYCWAQYGQRQHQQLQQKHNFQRQEQQLNHQQQQEQLHLQQQGYMADLGNYQMGGAQGYGGQMMGTYQQVGQQEYPMINATDVFSQMTPFQQQLMHEQYRSWQQMQLQQQAGQQQYAEYNQEVPYPTYQGHCSPMGHYEQVDHQGQQAMPSDGNGYAPWNNGQGPCAQGGPYEQFEQEVETEVERTVESPVQGSADPSTFEQPGNENPKVRSWHTPTEWDGEVVNVSDCESETGVGAAQPEITGEEAPYNFEAEAQAPFNFEAGAQAPFNFEAGAQAPFNFEAGAQAPFNFEAGAQAPFNFEAGTQAPFNFEAGAQAPFNFEAAAQAPFNFEAGAQAPFNFEAGAEAPESFETGAEDPQSFGTTDGASKSFGTGAEVHASFETIAGTFASFETTAGNLQSFETTAGAFESFEVRTETESVGTGSQQPQKVVLTRVRVMISVCKASIVSQPPRKRQRLEQE